MMEQQLKPTSTTGAQITVWLSQPVESDSIWEAAYNRFETPHQELRKFLQRLHAVGAAEWPRDARIVELFCGRGTGLKALEFNGFNNLEGVDLSASLLQQYRGPAHLYLGDCRSLQFHDDSKDVVLVNGGLHHLPNITEDLERVFREVRRILCPGGRFAFVEPWLTPFLQLVHAFCSKSFPRKLSNRLDALAVMIEQEKETYYQWLSQREIIQSLLSRYFETLSCRTRLGKIIYIGKK